MRRRSLLLGTVALLSSALILAGAAAPAKADEARPYAGQTINVMLPPWVTMPKDMTDRFTKETGISVNLQNIGWDDIRTKIVTSMLAGSAPADVTEVDWSWVGQFGAAKWYTPLDKIVDPALVKDIPTAPIFSYDNQLIGLSYNNDYRLLILNKDHLQRAGVEAPPKTLDELLADAKAIKAKGIVKYPIALPLSRDRGRLDRLVFAD